MNATNRELWQIAHDTTHKAAELSETQFPNDDLLETALKTVNELHDNLRKATCAVLKLQRRLSGEREPSTKGTVSLDELL